MTTIAEIFDNIIFVFFILIVLIIDIITKIMKVSTEYISFIALKYPIISLLGLIIVLETCIIIRLMIAINITKKNSSSQTPELIDLTIVEDIKDDDDDDDDEDDDDDDSNYIESDDEDEDEDDEDEDEDDEDEDDNDIKFTTNEYNETTLYSVFGIWKNIDKTEGFTNKKWFYKKNSEYVKNIIKEQLPERLQLLNDYFEQYKGKRLASLSQDIKEKVKKARDLHPKIYKIVNDIYNHIKITYRECYAD